MLSALRTFLLRWTGMTEMTVMEDPAPLAAPGAGRSMSSGGLGSAAPPGCSLATDPDGADLQAAVPPGTGENFITSAARRGKRAGRSRARGWLGPRPSHSEDWSAPLGLRQCD